MFIFIMFAGGGRHIFGQPRAGVSALVYNLHNLHCKSHIRWLHTRSKVNFKKGLGNLGTAAHAHRAHGFHFLMVKCVLKCGVDHTWRRTSASLNYERFHGHQVKLK